MSSLDPDLIAQLLQEDAEKKARGRSVPRVDPTEERTVNVWFKLNHHICLPDCEHRAMNPNSDGRACWNPDCLDSTRQPGVDRGVNLVALVKGKWICRYCYLGGYLK